MDTNAEEKLISELKRRNEELYYACLQAKGVYEAVAMAGLDKILPGYKRCLKTLDRVLEENKSYE